MPKLNYSGEQTVDAQDVQTLISDLNTLHQDDTDITVSSASLRFQDDGSLRVITSLEADGDLAELDSLQESLTTEASDLGFQSSAADPADDGESDATDGDATDGVELL